MGAVGNADRLTLYGRAADAAVGGNRITMPREPTGGSGSGATGLEPATSGVTGRADGHDSRCQSTTIASSHAGSGWSCLREPAWSSEVVSGRLGHEWGTAQYAPVFGGLPWAVECLVFVDVHRVGA
jgi:hypothetical protein